jgi:hypothetical protein
VRARHALRVRRAAPRAQDRRPRRSAALDGRVGYHRRGSRR